MNSRWFNACVVLLWLATMSWLVVRKVLPPLIVGDPPSFARIIEAQKRSPPVGWRISLSGRRLGWALCETQSQPSGLTDVRTWVHCNTLPLREIVPGWSRMLSKLIDPSLERLPVDARSLFTFDPLGRLAAFDSAVQLGAANDLFGVRGTVEDGLLQLTVRTAGVAIATEAKLASDSLLGDALSPQTDLPGLRDGQKWTVPVYNPLCPSNNPLEIIHAKVEDVEPLKWSGVRHLCWVVVYRNGADGGVDDEQNVRGKLWVRHDGKVLRQQVVLFKSVLVFTRLSDDEAMRLVGKAARLWQQIETGNREPLHD